MSEQLPLPNDSAARTPDGTLLDARDPTPTPNPTSSPTPDPTPTSPTPNDNAPKPTDPAAPKPTSGVPESYTFKTTNPDAKPDEALVSTFTPIFRELGLTQAQADKLVEAYNGLGAKAREASDNAIAEMGRKWDADLKADPDMGPKLDSVKAEIGRALDLLPAAERTAFQDAMNTTMAGNHPAFVKAFWRLAQRVGPGTPVTGSGPSPHGQSNSGNSARPSVASSIWPTLKAS